MGWNLNKGSNFANITYKNKHSLRTVYREVYIVGIRVSNCVTRFLKQFEAERIEAMEIGYLLTKIEVGSSSMLATI